MACGEMIFFKSFQFLEEKNFRFVLFPLILFILFMLLLLHKT